MAARKRERTGRVADNERSFRAYNRRREAFEKDAVSTHELVPFVCECADTSCYLPITLTVDEFEEGHSEVDRFAVRPGHVLPEFEEVVERHDRYWIVRKFSLEPAAVDPAA